MQANSDKDKDGNPLKRLALFLAFIGILGAQSLTPTAPATVKAGQSADVSINLSTGASLIAAAQWTFGFPAIAVTSAVGWSTGPAAAASSKSVSCGPPSNAQICLVAGLNVTPISGGVVAVGHVTFPTSTRGSVVFSLTDTLGADGAGNAIPIAGGTVSINVTSPFDLNGDGHVDSLDLALAESQVVGATACGSADFNQDGKCNVQDIALLAADSVSPNP